MMARKRGVAWQALIAALLLLAGPAGAVTLVQLGGVSESSAYTASTGRLSFDGTAFVTSENVPGDGDVLDLANVSFEVQLNPLRNNGTPFNPATDNPNQAQFMALPSGFEFEIFLDGGGGPPTTLLVFEITDLDVTNASRANPPADQDGSITLGDASATATSSMLTVAGGTLNMLVGGVGTEARLSVLFPTLTPAIPCWQRQHPGNPACVPSGDPNPLLGYFGADWAGQDIVWDMTIFHGAPEPSTALLTGFGLLGLVALARRRRSG